MAKHADTVEELQTDMPIWTPADAALTDAWTCGQAPVLRYGTIQISFERNPRTWGKIDIDKKWARTVRESGGRIETVLGRPAHVHLGDATGSLPKPAHATSYNSVKVVVHDTMIIVVATENDVPVERLVELTDSIELRPHLTK